MSKFTKEMVDDYADKLLIGLTPEENKMVLDEFDIIDNQINIINDIPGIEKVEPMTHALDDFEYELREDVVVESELDSMFHATYLDGELPNGTKVYARFCWGSMRLETKSFYSK